MNYLSRSTLSRTWEIVIRLFTDWQKTLLAQGAQKVNHPSRILSQTLTC